MRIGTSTRRVVAVAAWIGWARQLWGIEIILKDWDDPDRLFTFIVGIPFIMAKLIIRSPSSVRERKRIIAEARGSAVT